MKYESTKVQHNMFAFMDGVDGVGYLTHVLWASVMTRGSLMALGQQERGRSGSDSTWSAIGRAVSRWQSWTIQSLPVEHSDNVVVMNQTSASLGAHLELCLPDVQLGGLCICDDREHFCRSHPYSFLPPGFNPPSLLLGWPHDPVQKHATIKPSRQRSLRLSGNRD